VRPERGMVLSDILGHEPMFQLQIKFLGGGKVSYGEYATHLKAIEAIKKFVGFLKEEHKVNRTGNTFELEIINADVYSVTKVNNLKRYNNAGLYLVFYIVETIGDHLSEEEKLRIGINPHKELNGEKRAYEKRPQLPEGDVNWSEL
jgi:hypothetical protein